MDYAKDTQKIYNLLKVKDVLVPRRWIAPFYATKAHLTPYL